MSDLGARYDPAESRLGHPRKRRASAPGDSNRDVRFCASSNARPAVSPAPEVPIEGRVRPRSSADYATVEVGASAGWPIDPASICSARNSTAAAGGSAVRRRDGAARSGSLRTPHADLWRAHFVDRTRENVPRRQRTRRRARTRTRGQDGLDGPRAGQNTRSPEVRVRTPPRARSELGPGDRGTNLASLGVDTSLESGQSGARLAVDADRRWRARETE